MYIVAIAWIYVTLMMSVVEATSSNGTVLGASVTFNLYGILPTAIIVYIMGTPGRRRARLAAQKAGNALASGPNPVAKPPSDQPDPSGHAAGGPPKAGSVPAVRKVP